MSTHGVYQKWLAQTLALTDYCFIASSVTIAQACSSICVLAVVCGPAPPALQAVAVCRSIGAGDLANAELALEEVLLYGPDVLSPAGAASNLQLHGALHMAWAAHLDQESSLDAGLHYIKALSAYEWATAAHPPCWDQVCQDLPSFIYNPHAHALTLHACANSAN